MSASTPEVDSVIGDGSQNFVRRLLHIGESSQARKAGPEDIQFAEDPGGVIAALVVTLMVVTELLPTKRGRPAESAAGLG